LSTTSPEKSAPSSRRRVSSGTEILRLVEEQVKLGPRVPGTEPHDALAQRLEDELRSNGAEVTVQEFPIELRGTQLRCRNVVGVFRAADGHPGSPLLLGTHYDTRIRADREKDLSRRESPIPGANDGGSGTAVFLHMLPRLAAEALPRDVAVAFLDAEDLGNIDGKDFALGAEWLAGHPVPGFPPAEVVILDMIGGKDMVLDIDAHILNHPSSRQLTTEVFRIGMTEGWAPFVRDKKDRLKYIISDHTPFAQRGTPACILIDIDYPQWHTQSDLPDAMSAESLGVIEEALWLFLSRPLASDPRSSPAT
jgi:glutaminyl-peptide cyclotransferase